jgi:hypothetical protein
VIGLWLPIIQQAKTLAGAISRLIEQVKAYYKVQLALPGLATVNGFSEIDLESPGS